MVEDTPPLVLTTHGLYESLSQVKLGRQNLPTLLLFADGMAGASAVGYLAPPLAEVWCGAHDVCCWFVRDGVIIVNGHAMAAFFLLEFPGHSTLNLMVFGRRLFIERAVKGFRSGIEAPQVPRYGNPD
jgi:hypothetical protein